MIKIKLLWVCCYCFLFERIMKAKINNPICHFTYYWEIIKTSFKNFEMKTKKKTSFKLQVSQWSFL